MADLTNLAKITMKSGLFLFMGSSTSTLLLALNSIIIARLLGPEDYGLYTVVMIMPTLFIALSDFGLSATLTRYIAHHRIEGRDDKASTLIRAAFTIKAPLTLLISLLLWSTSDYLATYFINRPETGPLIRLASLYLIGQASIESINSIFMGQDEAEKSGMVMVINAISRIFFSPYFILIGLGVSGAVLGMGLGSVIASVTGAIMLISVSLPKLKRTKNDNPSLSDAIKTSVIYGVPLYMSAIVFSFQGELRRIFLALFTTNEKIGNYATAVNFSALITVLVSPIASSLFPAFSKIDIEKDNKSMEKMVRLSIKYISMIIIPISFCIIILSNDLISFLYGSQYQTASYYLSLYMLIYILTSLGMYVADVLLNSQGKTTTTLKMKMINFITFIPLSIILIPYLEPPGLIISIFISQLISLIYGIRYIHINHHIGIDWMSSIKIIASSALSTLPVTILLKVISLNNAIINIILGVSTFLAFFLFITPLFGTLNKEDYSNIKNISNGFPFLGSIIGTMIKVEIKISNLFPR